MIKVQPINGFGNQSSEVCFEIPRFIPSTFPGNYQKVTLIIIKIFKLYISTCVIIKWLSTLALFIPKFKPLTQGIFISTFLKFRHLFSYQRLVEICNHWHEFEHYTRIPQQLSLISPFEFSFSRLLDFEFPPTFIALISIKYHQKIHFTWTFRASLNKLIAETLRVTL